ncbi:MAG: hypothetical protein SPL89_03055 [Clostridia bacterium]|nr:hypothetical protein [Clostridia bacterium]
MQTTRNIIILNNLGSENIEQAIIILKNKSKLCAPQEDIVFEAQKVIDDFIAKNKRQARRIREVRSALVLMPVAAILGLMMFLIFKFL